MRFLQQLGDVGYRHYLRYTKVIPYKQSQPREIFSHLYISTICGLKLLNTVVPRFPTSVCPDIAYRFSIRRVCPEEAITPHSSWTWCIEWSSVNDDLLRMNKFLKSRKYLRTCCVKTMVFDILQYTVTLPVYVSSYCRDAKGLAENVNDILNCDLGLQQVLYYDVYSGHS